jgi:translation initiation factor 4E
MLAAIGETFDPYLTKATNEGDETPTSLITGVIVSTRPQFYRLSIWTRQAPAGTGTPEDEKLRARIEAIGKHFKTQVRNNHFTRMILC